MNKEDIKDDNLRNIIMNEPDFHIFEHQDLLCVIIRSVHSGSFLGYVGVELNHDLYNVNYNNLKSIHVHGGITFSGEIYVVKNDDKKRWYFGFDTCHYQDISPFYHDLFNSFAPSNSKYRDFNFMIEQTKSLAEQLKNYKKCA
jgi:hypothetical protein